MGVSKKDTQEKKTKKKQKKTKHQQDLVSAW